MSRNLYACCHITEFPVQAALRLRPALRGEPVAVLEGDVPLERVVSRNGPAARLGVCAGMTRAEIDTVPAVRMLRRSAVEEISAKAALQECLGAFSPGLENMSRDGVCTLVADIAGTERLLGAPAVVAQAMMARTAALGLKSNVAVSMHVPVALYLARFGRTVVIEAGREREALASLPVRVLDLSPQHSETLAQWGIRTLGELVRLSPESLVTRFGQEGERLHQLASGTRPHLFRPEEPQTALEEVIEFDRAVDLLDPLLFVLGSMLEQLLLRARGHARAIEKLILTLYLEGGAEHEVAVRPALPSEHKTLLLKLLHLAMQAHPSPAPVERMRLEAEAAATKKVQLGLFSPQLPESSRLDVTLARLRAIVGDDRVGSPVLSDNYQEDAFHLEPFALSADSRAEWQIQAGTAMRQLRPPEPVRVVTDHAALKNMHFRGERFSIQRAYGPWQSSGAWWSAAPWTVEQWDVIATSEPGGRYLACCLVRDRTDGCWRMAGMYD